MGPFPEALKEEIKKFHPGLSDDELNGYLKLVEDSEYIDPVQDPEKKKQMERKLEGYVKTHLPNLAKAQASYAKKMEESYAKSIQPKLKDPVEIALSDRRITKWLRERSVRLGAYSTALERLETPNLFLVVFSFKDDSRLEVRIDQVKRRVYPDFKRTVN